jgi:hypothetical protein
MAREKECRSALVAARPVIFESWRASTPSGPKKVDSPPLLDEDRNVTPEVASMTDNDCADAGLKAQDTALELYQLAALMLGDEGDALNLVEQTVSQAEIDPCEPEEAAVDLARHQLIAAAVEKLKLTDPQAFAAPLSSDAASNVCIEDDDLSAAGITSAELAQMVSGTGRDELRCWLEKLPLAQRAIFVQRAVLGWDNGATAATLKQGAGSGSGWQPQQVSDLFRQALCSLANSLVHSAAAHKIPA